MDQLSGTLHTKDFNYFIADSTEFIICMLIEASAIKPAPAISSIKQFMNFNETGYIKVVVNFRFIPLEDRKTRATTETRIWGETEKDRKMFARYWRVVYPGSAIIRRMWLDKLAEKCDKK